jgi:L-fuconolactonase
MIVDAHQHFWSLAQQGRDWPTPDLEPIYRDFDPADLQPLLREHGVGATVLVQSMASEADTERMLEQAERTPWIAAVVGWTDLKAPDAPARIARLARAPKLRGLRPMLQGLDDDNWIDDPALAPAVEAMLAHRLAFDALVMPRHLPGLVAFARRHATLPIVIDHAAKPAIAGGQPNGPGEWGADLARLAALPNVHCKLSGLVTEAAPGWRTRDLQPWVAHVLECFGPHRILWGSDWPVLNLAADYARWVFSSRELLAHLDSEQRAAVFGGNACRFYRIEPNPN